MKKENWMLSAKEANALMEEARKEQKNKDLDRAFAQIKNATHVGVGRCSIYFQYPEFIQYTIATLRVLGYNVEQKVAGKLWYTISW